jgi:HEAT repeat protein
VQQPAPAVSLSPPLQGETPPPPPAENNTPPVPIVRGSSGNDLTALNDPSPQARADAIIALGRGRDRQAVSPITRALREDDSPQVREAAARALGLIGLPWSLDALQRAAQADKDRDVRKSASFAADVIRANMRH